jgi:hypothetical protein
MIAIRLAMLALTCTLLVSVLAAGANDMQPSARRVVVAAAIALIAPLFWPGTAKTFGRTALIVTGWSCAATVLAAVAVLLWGASGQSLARGASVCAVLLLIMLVTHAVAAGLEGLVAAKCGDPEGAREIAGCLATLGLAIIGSLPLWLGPAAELVSDPDAAVIDGILGVSPLAHLAVASGNDLLRNQWFYQHSNLAALRYSYPSLITVTATYIVIALFFVVVPLALRRSGAKTGSTTPYLTTERAP